MGSHKGLKGLLRGPKFSGNHSTVIPTAIPVVLAAKESPHVTKIGLGIITPVRAGAQPHIKFTSVSGGLKMQVRGNNAVQLFWLYTTEPDTVIKDITTKWENR
jgi:hypothetical protein